MTRTGGCNCGAVRLSLEGEPSRAGVCHCHTCRRETGSAFMAFAVWDRSQATVTGETRHWSAGTDKLSAVSGVLLRTHWSTSRSPDSRTVTSR